MLLWSRRKDGFLESGEEPHRFCRVLQIEEQKDGWQGEPVSSSRRAVLTGLLSSGALALTGCDGFFVSSTTTTTLTSSASTATYDTAVTLTAKVVSSSATGTVTFYDNSTELGTATLSGGSCTYTTSSLAEETHVLYAIYGGDTTFNSSTSASVTVVISAALTTTTTTLAASTTDTSSGMSVLFTATLSSTAVTGTVQFYDGTTLLGSSTVSAGIATFTTTTLSVGSNVITADYVGDSSFSASTSGSITVTIT